SPVTTRRTPRSTLFPYTTLFRSLRRRRSRLRQRDLRHAQARAGERRQLPGDAEDGETVRAVRRDLDVEDVIVEAEIGDEVPSEGRVAVEDEDPRLVLRAESQLAL